MTKEKQALQVMVQQILKGLCNVGVKNFLHVMREGEDEETIAAHAKLFQHQSQLSTEKQDKLVVKRFLDLTYSKSNKILVTDYTKISTNMELYPILCSKQQVNEFILA